MSSRISTSISINTIISTSSIMRRRTGSSKPTITSSRITAYSSNTLKPKPKLRLRHKRRLRPRPRHRLPLPPPLQQLRNNNTTTASL